MGRVYRPSRSEHERDPMKTSSKLSLAAAAMAGLLAGASSQAFTIASAAPVDASVSSGVSSQTLPGVDASLLGVRTLADAPAPKHDCKGKNDCKGVGGCKTGDNGCKGKNSCKGKGGCKTSDSKLMASAGAAFVGVLLADAPAPKHDCKGKNDCKGVGGCKTGDNGCKGKNSCKGKGGCKTSS